MTIPREQVADLRPGDVVELRYDNYPETVIRGPLHGGATLYVAFLVVRHADGRPGVGDSLTVISRAPRPLYVNHERTTPIDGDVVRDGEDRLWMFDHFGTWQGVESTCEESNRLTGMEQPLTLLVDGNTKKVVVQ